MGLGDGLLLFANNVNVTVTAAVGDTIPIGDRDIANGEDLFWHVMVQSTAGGGVSYAAAGAATATFELRSDTDSTLVASPVTHLILPTTGKAALLATGSGTLLFRGQIPRHKTYKAVLGLFVTIATGPMTQGNITSFISTIAQAQRIYPSSLSF